MDGIGTCRSAWNEAAEKLRLSLAVWFDGIGILNLLAGAVFLSRFIIGWMKEQPETMGDGVFALSFASAGLMSLAIGEILARLREIASSVR